jgi:hypothetical protein
MEPIETKNQRFVTLGWGLLFVWLGAWWGFLENGLLPAGAGALGLGLILVGLNVVRWLKGVPINSLSSAFGALFLILGGMKLANITLDCPCLQMPVCALFMIILGGIVLVRALLPAWT